MSHKVDLTRVKFTALHDGGMGSLRLAEEGINDAGRRFGAKISELSFTDKDGVPVSVSLHIDQHGDLYEIDVFKADFSAVINFPDFS